MHKYWLENNYGEPTKIELYGYKYELIDGKICSEYDPRSGSSEIIYIMHWISYAMADVKLLFS